MRNIKHKTCEYCLESYQPPYYCYGKIWKERRFCNNQCKFNFNKGRQYSPNSGFKFGHTHSENTKLKMSLKGKERVGEKNGFFGKSHSNESKLKMSKTRLNGQPRKEKQQRNDSNYYWWRDQVRQRDNFTCKMNNEKCSGKIIVHHILGWSKFPELRYEVNNGITLCHFHHPRKRNDEMILSPFFQELVKNV